MENVLIMILLAWLTFGTATTVAIRVSNLTEQPGSKKEYRCSNVAMMLASLDNHVSQYSTSFLPEDEYDCRNSSTWDWTETRWGLAGGITGSPISPVRDQRRCGACWTIATVRAIEAAFRIYRGPIPELSVQQLLDCANGGRCQGGDDMDVYSYIVKNGGLAAESTYPYTGSNGTCDKRIGAQTSFVPGTGGTAGVGTRKAFINHRKGIFYGSCEGKVNHMVLVVGWGVTDDGTEFWKFKVHGGLNGGRMGI